MPKSRIRSKLKNGASKVESGKAKFKIGGRKSNKSALLMTTESLLDVLRKKSKDYSNARYALEARGVDVEAALNLTEDK